MALDLDAGDLARLQDALAKAPIVYLSGYCDHSACPARQVTVKVNDADGDLVTLLAERGLTCPVCGGPVMFDEIRANEERYDDEQRKARQSVLKQMYERDHGAGSAASCIPGRTPTDSSRVVGSREEVAKGATQMSEFDDFGANALRKVSIVDLRRPSRNCLRR